MTDDIAERMRRARVEDLMIMARGRAEDGIAPEAVAAAQAELAARDLPIDEIEEYRDYLEELQVDEDSRATPRLPISLWILFGIFGLTLVGMIGVYALHAQGRRQAARDALVATLAGLALMWGVLILLFALFD